MRRALYLFGVLLVVGAASALLAKPADAQVLGGSAVSATGKSVVPLRAPSYTSTAASGANGFACVTDGCRFDIGSGAADYWYSNGTSILTTTTVFATSFNANTLGSNSGTLSVLGKASDGATAIGVKVSNSNALTAGNGSKIAVFYSDNGSTEKAAITSTGAVLQTGLAFASLGTPSNGTLIYCTDCTIANPCAGGGTGAFAKRLNGAWVCN